MRLFYDDSRNLLGLYDLSAYSREVILAGVHHLRAQPQKPRQVS